MISVSRYLFQYLRWYTYRLKLLTLIKFSFELLTLGSDVLHSCSDKLEVQQFGCTLGTLTGVLSRVHTHKHTPPRLLCWSWSVSKGCGWMHCNSQVRDCESIQRSLLAVNKHVFLALFDLHYILFPPLLLAQLDFYQNTQTHTHTQLSNYAAMEKKRNSITLCTVVEMYLLVLYTHN